MADGWLINLFVFWKKIPRSRGCSPTGRQIPDPFPLSCSHQDGEVKLQGVDDWTPGPMKPYDELLERLYKIIEEHNPTVGHILSVSKDFNFFE